MSALEVAPAFITFTLLCIILAQFLCIYEISQSKEKKSLR